MAADRRLSGGLTEGGLRQVVPGLVDAFRWPDETSADRSDVGPSEGTR